MSLNAVLQPEIAKAHLLSLAVLIGIASAFSRRWWAPAFSLVAIATSGIVAVGLALALFALLAARGGPGIIPPIAFARGFVVGFVAYLLVFIAALALRPRPLRLTPLVLCITLLSFAAFNGAFVALPRAAGTTVTVYVRTPDSKPVSAATLIYSTHLGDGTFSARSDAEGRIVLPMTLGDTVDGEFAASATSAPVKLYISSPKDGGTQWGIQRHWSVFFGTEQLAFHSFFLGDFDQGHSIEVYLPPPDRPALLPYAALTNLAGRLQEAQQTGKMFNPEMYMQNLEAYLQLSAVASAYDPRSSVRYYAHDVFTYLALDHQRLESILKKLTEANLDAPTRERGIDYLIAVLQIPSTNALSWQQKRDLIQKRLDSDWAILQNVPKP